MLERDIDPIFARHRGFGIARCDNQPDPVVRRLVLALENPRVHALETRSLDRLSANHLRARPDRGDARSTRQTQRNRREQQVRSPVPPAPACDDQQCGQAQRAENADPFPWLPQKEPQSDAAGKGDDHPRSAIETGGVERRVAAAGKSGQVTAHTPRAPHDIRGHPVRSPHRYRRRPSRRHASVRKEARGDGKH